MKKLFNIPFQLFILSALLVLVSCSDKVGSPEFPNDDLFTGLWSPLQLGIDGGTLHIQDYLPTSPKIDSFTIHNGLSIQYDKATEIAQIEVLDKDFPSVSVLNLWTGDKQYSLILKKSNKTAYTFNFDPGDQVYETVQIAGDLNNWNPVGTDLDYINGKWSASLNLNPGTYQYQYVVDGNWILDPANQDSVDNNIGGFNSSLKLESANSDNQINLFQESYNDYSVNLSWSNKPEELIACWNNFKIPDEHLLMDENSAQVNIPYNAHTMERSFLRVWSSNSGGVSNDLLIPLSYGEVITHTADLERTDEHTQRMYFMMVDRFVNGDTVNDQKVRHPEVEERANYYGGDLNGISQKVDEGYFKDLHINTIWVSPITQNPMGAYREWPQPKRMYSGYHGYWPISSSKVDVRFGTNQDLKDLVAEVHDNDMNILLDYVANHVHQEHPIFKEHPDWATDLELEDGSLNIRLWDEQRLTTWFDTFLPSIDLSDPEIVEAMTDSAIYWMENFGFDGFRHDATKHVPELFWRTLTKKLKTEIILGKGRDIYQIGETFGSRELISSYISSGQMDGQFDFNLYFDARSVFSVPGESFSRLATSIRESLAYYGSHHLMGNISGNHDMARFISYASGALKYDEDAKVAGWERHVQVEDTIGYNKLAQLIAFMNTIPGVPVLYYGDEIGLPGANDPDNRRPMQFDSLDAHQLNHYNTVTSISDLRKRLMALNYGELEILHEKDESLVYARTYFNQIVLIAFNKSDHNVELDIDIPQRFAETALESNFGSAVQKETTRVTLTLAPHSFEILNN